MNKVDIGKYINTIQCCDCLEGMRRLPDKCVDLIVTSPPYNLKNSTGNGMKDGRGGKWPNAALINGYATYDDNMPYELRNLFLKCSCLNTVGLVCPWGMAEGS